MMFGTPLFWRETHKPGKFLIFEGRVVIVLLLMVMHIRPWTIALAFTVMGVLYFFDRKGVPADSILRYLRARLVGRRRTARGVHNQRVPVDFHFEAKMLRKRPPPPPPSGPPQGGAKTRPPAPRFGREPDPGPGSAPKKGGANV